MLSRILPLLIFGSVIPAFADSATQTDWSGGDWIWGPSGEWDNQFYLETNIEWDSGPGVINLHFNAEHIVAEDFAGASSVYSEDIDGDGDMDVLGAAYQDHQISWWENIDGSGASFIEHTIDLDFSGASSVYSEDIDGDGDMDVIGAAYHTSDVAWLENIDGSGTSWKVHIVDDYFKSADCVYSKDFDDDGDMDVLGSAGWPDHYISWWENVNGSGTAWTEHIVAENFWGVSSVYSEDLNGDGSMDVLGSANHFGEITWWDLGRYSSCGYLESSCLYLHNDPGWGSINWTAEEPAGTSVAFQVRACDTTDISSMGPWSDTLYIPCSLMGILNEYDSYFQYRAILLTSDSSITPVLEDITLTWNPVGIGDYSQVTEYLLSGAQPNPSSGSVNIGFAIPELSQVALSVYDLAGRLVITTSQEEYSPGVQQVQLGELTPGIYFCRMISVNFTATRRFVVIK